MLEAMGIDWIQAGALGTVATLFMATLGFILKAMTTLNQIANKCHQTQERSTQAIIDSTRVMSRVEKVTDQLHHYLLKYNGRQ
jgi:hypothetical protein